MIDVFTEDEVRRAKDVLKTSMDSVQVHRRVYEAIVTDEVMARIDTHTGQANDRHYMAYRLEYLAQHT